MLSNGINARDIRDFEEVMNDEDFRVLNEIVDEETPRSIDRYTLP